MKNISKVFFAAFITVFILILSQSGQISDFLLFFTMPFSSQYFFGTFLNSFSILLFASVAQYISLSTNNYNLGGEGQIYLGGFLCALILSHPAQSVFLNIMLFSASLLAVIFAGALVTFISWFLKDKKNVNELLSSFIISSVLIIFIDYLVSNPLRDLSSNLLATEKIAPSFRLHHFGETPLNPSIFISLFNFAVIVLFFMKTQTGKKFVLKGKSCEFAEFRGINVKKIDCVSLCLSGSLHALCGFFTVLGTYYTCYQGFCGGNGWNALSVALIAGGNPAMLFSGSLLLSYFYSSCNFASVTNSLSSGSSFILQAVVLGCVSFQTLFNARKTLFSRRKK